MYWPFLREEELGLLAALGAGGDHVVVHTNGAVRQAAGDATAFELLADLPDVRRASVGSPRWVLDRLGVYVRRARARRHAVLALRPDVTHVMYQNVFTDVVALRRLARTSALVSTVHDAWPHNRRLPRWAYAALLRRLYATSGEIVVLHDATRRILVDEFAVPRDRVHLVPHQVPRFRVEPRQLSTAPTALFFGTLRRNKGIDTLLAAAPALASAGIRLVIAGRGEADLEAAVHECAARVPSMHVEISRVSAPRKAELFTQADVVVLPYTSFASESGVLNDAYGHHLPVVVTDVASLGESVREHGTGWVVPVGDPVALAAAVTRACHDGAEWTARARASRARAEENPPEVTARRLREVYETAAARWHTAR